MKNILIPHDYSEYAKNALEFGAELAVREGAKLTICYVVYVPPTSTGMLLSTLKQVKADAYTELEEMANDLKKKMASEGKEISEIECLVSDGVPVDKICSLAKTEEADLIIMGTQGATGLQEVFLGSNTGNVIKKADIPVLAIPGNSKFSKFKTVVYASDWASGDRSAIDHLIHFNSLKGADFHVVHVVKEGENFEPVVLEKLKNDFLSGIDVPNISFEIQKGENILAGINEYSKKVNADLIAMLNQDHGFFGNLFHRSKTAHASMNTDIPLLAFSE